SAAVITRCPSTDRISAWMKRESSLSSTTKIRAAAVTWHGRTSTGGPGLLKSTEAFRRRRGKRVYPFVSDAAELTRHVHGPGASVSVRPPLLSVGLDLARSYATSRC